MFKLLKKIYQQIFLIDDTPQKIAIGLGLGASLGIFPGSGPLAALFLALVFRINRASALLGSLLTNTWLSWVTLIPAVKIGAYILRLEWQAVYRDAGELVKSFHLAKLFKFSFLEIIFPVLVGYLVLSFCLGIAVYLITLLLLLRDKRKRSGSTLP